MSDTFNIKIGNDPENIYDTFPANREFKKRAQDDNHPIITNAKETGGFGWTETKPDAEIIHTIDPKYIGGSTDYDMVIHYSIDPEGGYIGVKYPDETELANTVEKMKTCYDNNVPYSGKIAFLLDDDYSTKNYICHDVIGYNLSCAYDGTPTAVKFGVIYPTNFTKVGIIKINLRNHTVSMDPAN